MTLGIRKLIVLSTIGLVFLLGNAVVVAGWLSEHGLVDFAVSLRKEFLTGTAITVILALVVLLAPGRPVAGGRAERSCPVCGKPLLGGSYCSECGSKV